MLGLAILCTFLYTKLFATSHFVSRIQSIVTNPEFRDNASTADKSDQSELRILFRENVRKRLKLSRTLIIAAPLLGLLGTVMGMLDTFQALSRNKSVDTTLSVADGISMALITTQAGLMIALPALFLTEWIRRRAKRCERHLYAKRNPHAA